MKSLRYEASERHVHVWTKMLSTEYVGRWLAVELNTDAPVVDES